MSSPARTFYSPMTSNNMSWYCVRWGEHKLNRSRGASADSQHDRRSSCHRCAWWEVGRSAIRFHHSKEQCWHTHWWYVRTFLSVCLRACMHTCIYMYMHTHIHRLSVDVALACTSVSAEDGRLQTESDYHIKCLSVMWHMFHLHNLHLIKRIEVKRMQ